jgi:hypothetical protein
MLHKQIKYPQIFSKQGAELKSGRHGRRGKVLSMTVKLLLHFLHMEAQNLVRNCSKWCTVICRLRVGQIKREAKYRK